MNTAAFEELPEDYTPEVEVLPPEEQIHLQLQDTKAPAFLIEGVCCQSMVDLNLSMQSLAGWSEADGMTYLQSAQATCRSAAMVIRDVRHVCKDHKRMADPRHSAFKRMCEAMAKRLLELEPLGPDVESENDVRVCQSIKLICKFLQYGNIALDTKSTPAERKLAVKEFGRDAR